MQVQKKIWCETLACVTSLLLYATVHKKNNDNNIHTSRYSYHCVSNIKSENISKVP